MRLLNQRGRSVAEKVFSGMKLKRPTPCFTKGLAAAVVALVAVEKQVEAMTLQTKIRKILVTLNYFNFD